jgi:hypothetical protein
MQEPAPDKPRYSRRTWSVEVTEPWFAGESDADAVFQRREGIGTLQISTFPKRSGAVAANEAWSRVKVHIPADYTAEPVVLGAFRGHSAEYVHGPTRAHCKVWLVESVRDVLFITYECPQGSEWRELDEVHAILGTLRTGG